jgi:hypothetical protein
MTTERTDVLAVIGAAVMVNGSAYLAVAENPDWSARIESAKQRDRDFTMTMAGIGMSNPDRDNALCVEQREQRRRGVARCSTPDEAIARALEWRDRDPANRGVRMYADDAAALARVGGAA